MCGWGSASARPRLAGSRPFRVSLSGGALDQHYAEYPSGLPNASTLPNPLDTESGTLPLLRLAFAFTPRAVPLWVQVRYDYAEGDTIYDGHTQALVDVATTTQNRMDDARARLGCVVNIATDLAVVPFLEGGWHAWDRQIGAGTPLYTHESYAHWYRGVGAQLRYRSGLAWRLVLDLDGGRTVDAQISGNGPLFYFRAPLGAAAYYGASIGVDRAFTGPWHLRGELSWTRFTYGASPSVATNDPNVHVVEPESSTRRLGFSLGLAYAF